MDENEVEYLSTITDQDQKIKEVARLFTGEKPSIFTPVNKDCRGYTNCFKCTKCGANIYTADYSRGLEYSFCPYCGEAD